MDTGTLVFLVGALGTLIGVFGREIREIIKTKSDSATKQRRDAIDEWREYVAKKDADYDRLSIALGDMQRAVQAQQEENAECREDYAEQRSINHFLYERIKQCHSELREANIDPGELPELPKARERHKRPEQTATFAVRQAEQSVRLVTKASEAVKESEPPPPGS